MNIRKIRMKPELICIKIEVEILPEPLQLYYKEISILRSKVLQKQGYRIYQHCCMYLQE